MSEYTSTYSWRFTAKDPEQVIQVPLGHCLIQRDAHLLTTISFLNIFHNKLYLHLALEISSDWVKEIK